MKELLRVVVLGILVLLDFGTFATSCEFKEFTVLNLDGRCPTDTEVETEKNRILEEIGALLRDSVITPCGPAWTRVTLLNMSDPAEVCPTAWSEDTSPDIRGCGRQTNTIGGSCDSVVYPTGMRYTQVCGRVIGHQFHTTDAFDQNVVSEVSIENPYVDGVSVTYGSPPRQHIWTFVSAQAEQSALLTTVCACNGATQAEMAVPSYVENNYFCETGFSGAVATGFGNDPLWDGQDCVMSDCCTFNSPPLFSVSLPASTTDDIEVRICSSESTTNENIYIELLELYVK